MLGEDGVFEYGRGGGVLRSVFFQEGCLVQEAGCYDGELCLMVGFLELLKS